MFVKFLGCVSKTMTFATGVKMKLVAKMGVFCHKLCEIKCNEKCVACFRIWRSFCEDEVCEIWICVSKSKLRLFDKM
jgi:hypothetical protein